MAKVGYVQMVFDRHLMQADLDEAIITSHWRHYAAASPDAIGADFDHAERVDASSKLTDFWNAIKSLVSNKYLLSEYRWYEIPDAAPHHPVFKEIITPTVSSGTSSSGPLPPQVSCSVTFKTAVRKNWGRFYVPGLSGAQLDGTGGYFTSEACDTIATNANDKLCHAGVITNGVRLTVWSPTEGTFHDPQKVQVDNVPDVIRRRRHNVTTYKKIVNV